MKIRTLKYYIVEAFKNIARNSLMALSSAATVASCIFIIIFSYCLAINIDYMLTQLESSVGISVIIDNELTDEEVERLFYEIDDIEHVISVEYITSQMALENFAKMLGESKNILKGLEEDNPLRRSFTLTLDDIRNQNAVISALKSLNMQNSGIANIREAKNVTDILIAINNVVRIVSLIVIFVLGTLSIIIIMNTIKLTVNNRRNEIKIMKYVGATDRFIKCPFVIEGILIGAVGSVLPVVISFTSYDRLVGLLIKNFPFIDQIVTFQDGIEIFPNLSPFVISLGILIGVIGSLSSLRKYLDA